MGRKWHIEKYKTESKNKQFVTRSQALHRLGLSLADFRKLCIIKGIFPRVPKRFHRGTTQTYYHIKDVRSISSDPIVNSFRTNHALSRKIKKRIGRRDVQGARRLLKLKKPPTLHHVVKQRYPSLIDAIADLDDPLSTLSMFAALRSESTRNVSFKSIRACGRALDHFHYYICRSGKLTKAFISIKGFYFQAEILGVHVTWQLPHQYVQELPYEVDFKVLATFGDFYRTLVNFVNYKLYSLEHMSYPPVEDSDLVRAGHRHLGMWSGSITTEKASVESAVGGMDVEEESSGDRHLDDVKTRDEIPPLQGSQQLQYALGSPDGVFRGLVVFLCREVPVGPVSIVMLSGGASVGWDHEKSPFQIENSRITHQFFDRTAEQMSSVYASMEHLPPREYVQPQWAFDCLNAGILLPTLPYGVGKQPPAHLSPFVDDYKEGYVPKQRMILNDLIEQHKMRAIDAGLPASGAVEEEDVLDTEAIHLSNMETVKEYQCNIEREAMMAAGRPPNLAEASENATVELPAEVELQARRIAQRKMRMERKAKQQLERQTAMMSRTKKKLKQQLDGENEKRSKQIKRLMLRRDQLEADLAAAGGSIL